jgi:hypothetical protein
MHSAARAGQRAAAALKGSLNLSQTRWAPAASVLPSLSEDERTRTSFRTTAPGLTWVSQHIRLGCWQVSHKRLMATTSDGQGDGHAAKPPSSPPSSGTGAQEQQRQKPPLSPSFTAVSLKHPATSSSFSATAGKGQWSAASLGSRIGMNAGRGSLGIPPVGMGMPNGAPEPQYDPVSFSFAFRQTTQDCIHNHSHKCRRFWRNWASLMFLPGESRQCFSRTKSRWKRLQSRWTWVSTCRTMG